MTGGPLFNIDLKGVAWQDCCAAVVASDVWWCAGGRPAVSRDGVTVRVGAFRLWVDIIR